MKAAAIIDTAHGTGGLVVGIQKQNSVMDAIDIANHWRRSQPAHRQSTGVVLIWDGKVYGWKSELRYPGHERPGAFAVGVAGNVWIARGGNDRDGALVWAPATDHKR